MALFETEGLVGFLLLMFWAWAELRRRETELGDTD